MSPLRESLWIVLLCAGCGAVDAREPPATSDSGATLPMEDAALERVLASCGPSCPPDQRLALAQRLLERSQDARHRALDAEERAFTAPRDSAAQQQARAAGDAATRDAARDRQRAIELLRVLTGDASVPPTRVVETALSELLFALADEQARDEVRALAERIVRDAPTRPIAAHAWLALADRAFEDMELTRARDAYLATIAVPDAEPRVTVYARYKLGWTLLNLSDFRGACDAFREVARTDGQPQLAREAQRDFTRALVPLDGTATDDIAALRGVARDEPQAVELAARYEAALRDAGLDARADAFRAAWH
jgi:hypothetical protein